MAVKEKSESDNMEWSVEEETQLFFALDGLKPVGINKHFYMACICDRLSKSLKREISSDAVWEHLNSLYNMRALDQMELLAFPPKQKDFVLPDAEFSALMTKKLAEVEEATNKNETTGTKGKPPVTQTTSTNKIPQNPKDNDKKVPGKIQQQINEMPKRNVKRTRGSVSLESNSPSTTPPPQMKRRRI